MQVTSPPTMNRITRSESQLVPRTITYNNRISCMYRLHHLTVPDSRCGTGMIGARASSLLADGLVLVLTWLRLLKTTSCTVRNSTSLASVLVTDSKPPCHDVFLVHTLISPRQSWCIFFVSLESYLGHSPAMGHSDRRSLAQNSLRGQCHRNRDRALR